MKNLKNQTVFLHFLFAILLGMPLQAQVVIPIDSNEVLDVYPHLDLNYKGKVQVDSAALQSHVDLVMNTATYSSSLDAPLPTLTDWTNSSAEFSWGSVSGAGSYQVDYINLDDASKASVNTTGTSLEITGLDGALYLFTFISLSGSDQSEVQALLLDLQVDLIIVDTEILLQGPSEEDLECDCTPLDTLEQEDQFNLVSTVTIPWQGTTAGSKYKLEISASDASTTYTTDLYFIHEEINNAHTVYYLSLCDSNYTATNPYQIGIPGVVETVVSTEGIHLYFVLNGLTSFTVLTNLCESEAGTNRSSAPEYPALAEVAQFRAFPNPVYNNAPFTLSFKLQQAGPVSLHCYDIMGKLLISPMKQEYLEAGVHEIYISTLSVPAGSYYWVLKTDYQLLSSSLQMMN